MALSFNLVVESTARRDADDMFERKLSRAAHIAFFALVLVVALVGLFPGCRNAPFYRMTNRASMSLPLSREGIVAYERGDLSLAEEKFEQALRLNDSDIETNRYYGETLWKLGKRQKAMLVLREAAEKHGAVDAESSLYRSLGEKSLELDESQEALQWANKIVDLTPKNSDGWALRGKVYRHMGRRREALSDFQRAAHFSIDDRELLREIAVLQGELNDFDSALATWQCLEKLYPTNHEPAEVFAGIGGAYAGLGLYLESEGAYAVAVRYAPEEPDYRVKLAEVLLARGEDVRALAVIEEGRTITPESAVWDKLDAVAHARTEQVAGSLNQVERR